MKKFRAWDKKNKRWIVVTNIVQHADRNDNTFSFGELNVNYVLMQFTGFKDKNKKEIYEGDILEWKHGDLLEVRWGNGEFVIWSKLFKSFGQPDGGITGIINARGYFKNSKIIGNKFENPIPERLLR